MNCPEDAVVFQENINAVYEWARMWKMPVNDSKFLAINFGKVTPAVQRKLGTTCLAWAKNTKYLEVTIQSDLTFDLHIAEKSIKSNKILDGIKHLMHNAPQEAKLLAYTSLCRPILEYADVVWDPSVKSTVHNIELIQNKAIRFIANLEDVMTA